MKKSNYLLLVIFFFIFNFILVNVKGNNLQLISLENNQFMFFEFNNVKDYHLKRKKKVNYIEIAFSDSNKTIALSNIWGLIFNNASKGTIDTFLIDKGSFSLPHQYKLIAGNINDNAIFYREQYIFVLYGNINFDKYYLTENKKIINAKSKKYLAKNVINQNVKKVLLSSKKSVEWFLKRDKKSNEIRLLSLYTN